MKKFYILFICIFMTSPAFAQEEEIMIIHPGRETFIHFPSAVLGNQYTLTVFLPEKAIPLSKRYPVVYLLGAGPQQAQEAQRFLEKNKVLVVGINFKESDYQNRTKIVEFISRELVPYIDTNYLTFTDPSQRIIAARGKGAAITAIELLSKPNLFGGMALASSADALASFQLPAAGRVRVFVTGRQAELAFAQEKLEQAGLTYGPDFALAYAASSADIFDGLDWEYLSAPAEKVTLRRLKATIDSRRLLLDKADTATLWIKAYLTNGRSFDYIPVSLRISPPYLDWNAKQGEIRPLAGAEPGTVQIRGGVDKIGFRVKIKLKKQ